MHLNFYRLIFKTIKNQEESFSVFVNPILDGIGVPPILDQGAKKPPG